MTFQVRVGALNCVRETESERVFCLTDFVFNQVSVEEFGEVKTHVLKEDGENIPVNNDNREGSCGECTCSSGNILSKSSRTYVVRRIRPSIHGFNSEQGHLPSLQGVLSRLSQRLCVERIDCECRAI